jgi:hypothetical protein
VSEIEQTGSYQLSWSDAIAAVNQLDAIRVLRTNNHNALLIGWAAFPGKRLWRRRKISLIAAREKKTLASVLLQALLPVAAVMQLANAIIGALLQYLYKQIFGGLQRGFCAQIKIFRQLMRIPDDERELGEVSPAVPRNLVGQNKVSPLSSFVLPACDRDTHTKHDLFPCNVFAIRYETLGLSFHLENR